MRRLALALALLAWLGGCAAPGRVLAPAEAADPARDMLVTVVAGAGTDGVFRALAAEYGLALLATWPIRAIGVDCAVFRAPDAAAVADLLARLAADRRVEAVQRLALFETAAPPWNDPLRPLQTEARALRLDAAHADVTGRGVRIAVLDSGIDADHEDLAGRIAQRVDVVAADGPGRGAAPPRERHGTAMAGVIAAAAGNGRGVVGVAPGAMLLGVRACWEGADRVGRCSSFTLARGLAAAIAARPDVLNLSLRGPADPLLGRLAAAAVAAGIVVVAAEAPATTVGFAAGLPGVLRAGPAGGGGVIGLPAGGSVTTVPGGYDVVAGGSVAAAQASGLVALLLEAVPGLDAAALRRALLAGGEVPDACRALAVAAPTRGWCGESAGFAG